MLLNVKLSQENESLKSELSHLRAASQIELSTLAAQVAALSTSNEDQARRISVAAKMKAQFASTLTTMKTRGDEIEQMKKSMATYLANTEAVI